MVFPSPIGSGPSSYHALRAVLHTLRNRLPLNLAAHADLAAGRKDRLLYLDGFDLRRAGLAERKRLLVS